MNKGLLFFFSLVSIAGLYFGIQEGRNIYSGFDFAEFFTIWLFSSLGLIIQLIYNLIFRDK
jgi:hypothetical protein